VWPLLWSSSQNSWLQIQRPEFDSRRYQIFWVVGLERGPLSLMSAIEELLEIKSSCSGLESREYGRRDTSSWPGGTLYPQTLALTSPICGGWSVGIVRSRTQATKFSFSFGVSSVILPRISINVFFNRVRTFWPVCHIPGSNCYIKSINTSQSWNPADQRGYKLKISWMIFLSIYLILPATLDPMVHSAFNRNEYQKQKNNASGEWSAAGA
jgi:hypothetical protein